MKHFITLLLALTVTISFAQKKPKIKGNKKVTSVTNALTAFNELEISDDLEVTLNYSNDNSYTIETDENLVDVVKFDIAGSKLKVYTTHRIRRSKMLKIKINSNAINFIILRDDAKLVSNKIKAERIQVSAYDDASYKLKIKATDAVLNLHRSTNGKLDLDTDNVTFNLDQNAFLECDLKSASTVINSKDRSDIKLEGNSETIDVHSNGSSQVKAKKLETVHTNIHISENADVYILSEEDVKINALDDSEIYLYGTPQITIEAFDGNTKLQKKS